MAKQKMLITGTGGFVGKFLKEFYKQKYHLYTPRSKELDCTDTQAVEEFFKKNNDIDYIIHCGTVGGARGVEDKSTTIDENLLMVDNLLKFKKTSAKIILFGSGAMYDKSRSIIKANESEIGLIEPYDLYGKSKMMIAQKVKDRKDCVCLNIFGCYGPGEKETRFPTYALKQYLSKQPIIINQNVVFDYLYIEDLAKIIEHFLNNTPLFNIINVTPTYSISLLEIANIINNFGAYKSKIVLKTKVMGNEYSGDNSRLLKEIPDFEFTEYEVGLRKFYEYLKSGDIIDT